MRFYRASLSSFSFWYGFYFRPSARGKGPLS
jgi:hypothetical protein